MRKFEVEVHLHNGESFEWEILASSFEDVLITIARMAQDPKAIKSIKTTEVE